MSRLQQSVVTGCDFLIDAAFGQQVAGQLFSRELVEGNVLSEGVNHPVSIRRNVVILIAVIANGVGISHEVQPVHRHSFSVSIRRKQVVNDIFVCGCGRIFGEFGDNIWMWRQPRQIEVNATYQCHRIGFGRRLQPFRFQPGQNEVVNPVIWPCDVLYVGSRAILRGDVSPVRIDLGSRCDPATQNIDFFFC